MADEVDVDDAKQDGETQDEKHDEQREEKKQERRRDPLDDGLALAAALILASQCGRGGRRGGWLPPVGRPGDVRVRTARGDGWWCW
jgi:hypothetical protein